MRVFGQFFDFLTGLLVCSLGYWIGESYKIRKKEIQFNANNVLADGTHWCEQWHPAYR